MLLSMLVIFLLREGTFRIFIQAVVEKLKEERKLIVGSKYNFFCFCQELGVLLFQFSSSSSSSSVIVVVEEREGSILGSLNGDLSSLEKRKKRKKKKKEEIEEEKRTQEDGEGNIYICIFF